MYGQRPAHKAGTWYSSDGEELRVQLIAWLQTAKRILGDRFRGKAVRAIIVPHAAYQYSGPTAAWAYATVPSECHKAVIFYPSHYSSRPGVYSSPYETLVTPLGPLEAHRVEGCRECGQDIDAREHAGEMQLPFLKVCKFDQVATVMVGPAYSRENVSALRDFLGSPKMRSSLLVISSDFCHYGPAYGFMPESVLSSTKTTSDAIRDLDMQAFEAIKSMRAKDFDSYLESSGNTICGRSCIKLMMELLSGQKGEWHLLDYRQSDPNLSKEGNSVSYIAAAFIADEG